MKNRIINIFFLVTFIVSPFLFIFFEANMQIEYISKPILPIASDSRSVGFSGYNWIVRSSGGLRQGPGPNYFNDSAESVWLDEDGYLHLKIRRVGEIWYCSEIYSEESFGYGMYVFRLSPGFEMLNVNIIVGLFTYLDDFHEIDIEYSRWGVENELKNGQFVVQPYYTSGNMDRYSLEQNGQSSMHAFYWCQDFIQFRAMYGTDIDIITQDIKKTPGGCDNLIYEWIYRGNDNPTPSIERVHINFWLRSGLAPSDENEADLVVEEFKFIPMDCIEPLSTECRAIDSFPLKFLLIFGFVGTTINIFLYRTKIKKHSR